MAGAFLYLRFSGMLLAGWIEVRLCPIFQSNKRNRHIVEYGCTTILCGLFYVLLVVVRNKGSCILSNVVGYNLSSIVPEENSAIGTARPGYAGANSKAATISRYARASHPPRVQPSASLPRLYS